MHCEGRLFALLLFPVLKHGLYVFDVIFVLILSMTRPDCLFTTDHDHDGIVPKICGTACFALLVDSDTTTFVFSCFYLGVVCYRNKSDSSITLSIFVYNS
jgi:hypothetical protein